MSLEAVNRPLGGLNGNLARLGIDVTEGTTPEDTILDLPVATTQNGKEISRVHQAAMVASGAAGGIFSFENPLDVPILILRGILEWTTNTSGACTVSMGVAADGTTLSSTLISGQSVASAAGVVSSTVPRRCAANGASGSFVTASVASGTVTGLVGRVYVEYIPIQ